MLGIHNRKIAVLMSTYNGEKFIKEQLDSILKQKGVIVSLYIRDDGSTDDTINILTDYSTIYSNVLIINKNKRRNIGAYASFFEIMDYAFHNITDVDYFAFSDQDDVWREDKLLSAIQSIDGATVDVHHDNRIILYYSNKTWVDKDLSYLHEDFITNRKSNYFDAVLPISAYGCTFVFNRILLETVACNLPIARVAHDLYMFRLAKLLNGVVIYDDKSRILYRRHDSNVSCERKKHAIIGIVRRKIINHKKFHGTKLYVSEIYRLHKSKMGKEQRHLVELILNYEHSMKDRFELLFYKEAWNRGPKCAIIWGGRVLMNAI